MRIVSALAIVMMAVALVGCSNYVLKAQYDRDVGSLTGANDALAKRNAELEVIANDITIRRIGAAKEIYADEVLTDLARRFREAMGGDKGIIVETGNGKAIFREPGDEAGETLFESGKAVVTEKFKKVLKTIADGCKEKDVHLVIVGHTDGTKIVRPETLKDTPSGMNLELGARRASAVAAALKQLGIAESRMVTMSYGQSNPEVAPEKSNADKAKNRRVEIYFLREQQK